jgi:L-alanine-DL-glutamate epimerase-like enolase superfamily enzyme
MTSAKAWYFRRDLVFRFDAHTSRGPLRQKPSWFLVLFDPQAPDEFGLGECSLIPGLSPETEDEVAAGLERLVKGINAMGFDLLNPVVGEIEQPAVRMAWDMARRDYQHGGRRVLYESPFVEGEEGIPINGLVWMGDIETMWQRLREKVEAGFRVIKLKVGSLDFEAECELLRRARREWGGADHLELRVDANGAFAPGEALDKLHRLSEFALHSIEQPIAPGQWDAMAHLCRDSPVPIALDEELIGVNGREDKIQLLTALQPAYLILKPSLLGGLRAADQWADLAEARNIGWWATSALESNIGLNAIAQWAAYRQVSRPQGLGTGQLFENNFPSPLRIVGDRLWYDPTYPWRVELPEERSA